MTRTGEWVRVAVLASCLAACLPAVGPALAAEISPTAPVEAPQAPGDEPRFHLGQALKQELKGFKDDVRRSAGERIHKAEAYVKATVEAKVEEKVFGLPASLHWWQYAVIAIVVVAMALVVLGVLCLLVGLNPLAGVAIGSTLGGGGHGPG